MARAHIQMGSRMPSPGARGTCIPFTLRRATRRLDRWCCNYRGTRTVCCLLLLLLLFSGNVLHMKYLTFLYQQIKQKPGKLLQQQ